ncbi:acyltransferase [Aerococcus urinaeequi]|uniref:Acyltransferase n=1 Tax=Aerococcus urinaeequi TaxID=51665 RepID=A0A7M1KRM5_9LACT|nr:acyltransferase [Aerococcus urinaeequi]QOQ78804.1 acyltransferase [Aerococcus urinaeequi]
MEKRQQNFELLRIIAMFMIVVSHVITHYIMKADIEISGVNNFLLSLVRAVIYICVNVYIIITGYFSVNSKQLKIKKIMNVALLPGFISAMLLMVLMVFGVADFDIWRILGKLFATFRGEYWFISNYFALCLFIPFLNKIIHTISKKEYQHFLFLSTLVGVVWPFFVVNQEIISINSGFSLIFFMYLYFVGAYIRLYGAFIKDFTRNQYLLGYLTLALITGFLQYFLPDVDFLNYNGPFEFIMSYCIFMYIRQIKVKSVRINTIAAYTLSVYLVHEQSEVREFIWNLPFIHQIIQWSPFTFIPAIIFVAVIVFTVSWIIGYMLTNIYKKVEQFVFYVLDTRAGNPTIE